MNPSNPLCDTCIYNQGAAKGYDKDIDPNRDFDLNCAVCGDIDKVYRCKKYIKSVV
jgi:hypothetical protein